MTLDPARVLIAVPTYNEIEMLETTARRIRVAMPAARILIVDDASPDGTGDLADRLAAADPGISVLNRDSKRGLGGAYRAAFRHALADPRIEAVIEFDADGSHDAAALPALLAAAATADLVIGSRYVPGGGTAGWSKGREALSRLGNAYARRLLGFPLRDATAGLRLYRRAVLQELDLEQITSDGYGFQIEMAWRTWLAGFVVVEVPIMFTERSAGASKMTQGIVFEALSRVLRWGLRRERPGRRHPRSAGA